MRHLRYPDTIMGKQRRNSISLLKKEMDDQGAKGVTFIIRFKWVGFLMDTKLCEKKTNIMSANNCGQVCSLILIEEVTIRRSEVLLI